MSWEQVYEGAGKEYLNEADPVRKRRIAAAAGIEPTQAAKPDAPTPDAGIQPMDMKGAGVAGAGTLAKGGSAVDAASAGLMASGNPYAMGAGLALGVVSSGKKRKDAEKKAEAEAEMQRRSRVMGAMQNFGAGIGSR